METLYRKVSVSERLPKAKEMLMTSHGWSLWNGHQFEDEDDKPISYINYWLDEIPDPTAQLKADKEELIENHFKLFRRLNSLVNRYKLVGFEDLLEKSREINRKHSEGGLNIVQSNP